MKIINKTSSPVGFEPTTSGLEVQRAIHCAMGTMKEEDSILKLDQLVLMPYHYNYVS